MRNPDDFRSILRRLNRMSDVISGEDLGKTGYELLHNEIKAIRKIVYSCHEEHKVFCDEQGQDLAHVS